MISLTGQYALRALIYLAQHAEDWPIPGSEIAEQAGVPAKYLSAILSNLVRAGVLESTRGKSGGFRMVRPPAETRLLDVLTPFEQFERQECPFGSKDCSDDDPCLAHEHWKSVILSFQGFLKDTSVFDVAVKKNRSRKARPSSARSSK